MSKSPGLTTGVDKKNTIHKSGSSNVLVDKTKSVVKLIIFVFTIALKVVLPNSRICVSEKSVLSNSVWSMLTKLFRSVRRSLLYKGQWRKKWIADSTSLPQLHIGFIVSWKLCLNLCSRRWLSFSQRSLSFVCFWRNFYRSALVPRNLPCLEKFLVARLHGEIMVKSMSQTKENCDSLVLSRSYLWNAWRCHDIPRVHFYYFCLEPMVKRTLECERFPSLLWWFSSIVALWKLLDHNCVQSSFSRITRYIENGILKDILQLNDLWTSISIRAKSLIKTSVNIINQKSMKVPGKR